MWPLTTYDVGFPLSPANPLLETSRTCLHVQSTSSSVQILSLLSFTFTEIPFGFSEPHFSFETFFFLEVPSPFTFHKDWNKPQPSGVLSCRGSLWFPISLWSCTEIISFIPRWQLWRALGQTLVQFCDFPAREFGHSDP